MYEMEQELIALVESNLESWKGKKIPKKPR